MSIILRATDDMIEMSNWVDVMINPVNCRGVAGKGLALAFKEYCPAQYEEYRRLCIEQQLIMGKLHIFYNEADKTTIINVPTKNHWIDSSNLDDVDLATARIAEFLKQHPFYSVALPMLGTGEGMLEHQKVLDIFYKYLDHLPNPIFVCMRVEKLPILPKYLVVAGSRKFLDYDKVEIGLIDAFCEFGVDYKDFTAFVGGGANGVDTIASGAVQGEAYTPGRNIALHHGVKPIVFRADWDRLGKVAGFIRNRLLLEAGTHFVLYQGSISAGTKMMRGLIETHNIRAHELMADLLAQGARQSEVEQMLPPTRRPKKLYVHDISAICE